MSRLPLCRVLSYLLGVASVFVWAWSLIGAHHFYRFSALPNREILLVRPAFSALLGCALGVFLAGRILAFADVNRTGCCASVIPRRLSLLPGLALAGSGLNWISPFWAGIVLFWGCTALFTWAVMPWLVSGTRRNSRIPTCSPVLLSRIVLIGFTALYCGIGLYFTSEAGEHSGDEGHYLIQVRSLYEDGDLDIRNQFDDPDTPRHGSLNSRGGAWYPSHSSGLPFLMAPFVPFGLAGRHFILALISACGLVAMFKLSLQIGASPKYAMVTVLLLGCGLYWGIYSSRALPEVLGATLTCWALLMCFRQQETPWRATLIAWLCISYLPWVQTRFIPVAIVLTGCFGLQGLMGRAGWKRTLWRLSVFTVACALGFGLHQLVQWRMYIDGQAYPVPLLLFSMPAGIWHTLASSRGILYTLPVFACAMVALPVALRFRKSRAAGVYALLLLASVLLTSSATIWFTGGTTVPGRFLLVVILPVMACLALAMTHAGPGFLYMTVFLGVSMVAGFVAFLSVVGQIGRYFADPFNLIHYHGLISCLPEFYYEPYEEFSLFPALAIYLGAAVLFYPVRRHRVARHAGVGILVVGSYILCAKSPLMISPGSHRTVEQLQNMLQYEPLSIFVYGSKDPPLSLLDYKNMLTAEPGSVTSENLGSIVKDGWISIPNIAPNDWEQRGYRWATLVPPFRVGKGRLAVRYEGIVSDQTGVEMVIREGSFNHIEKQYPPGACIHETFKLRARNRGDFYILIRLLGEEGSVESLSLSTMIFTDALLEKANLYIDPSD